MKLATKRGLDKMEPDIRATIDSSTLNLAVVQISGSDCTRGRCSATFTIVTWGTKNEIYCHLENGQMEGATTCSRFVGTRLPDQDGRVPS